jgi:hypothetical protein
MSMFKMENTEGYPKVKTYTESEIMSAVKAYVNTWPLEKVIEHVTASVYEEFMDRSKPRVRVDTLVANFGKNK